MVSDNGTPFNSHEFGKYCKVNGIRHIGSAPNHLSTNGEAKRFVQAFKRALRPQVENKVYVQTKIFKFYQQYLTFWHSTTRRSFIELNFRCTI